MARYVEKLQLDLAEEIVEQEIQNFFRENNFNPIEWKNEECYGADFKMPNGAPTPKNYQNIFLFKYRYTDGILYFEAWVRDGKLEINPVGFCNIMTAQILIPWIDEFERRLSDLLSEDKRMCNSKQMARILKAKRRLEKLVTGVNILAILSLIWAFYEVVRHLGLI